MPESPLQIAEAAAGLVEGNPAEEAGAAPAASAAASVAGAAESSVTAVPDLISRLTSRAFWIRLAEGLIGGLLLIFGINGLIHAATGTDIAGKVAKGAAVGAVL